MTAQQRPRVGDTAFEVEWCKRIPLTPEGEGDLDNAEYVVEHFPTLAKAASFARGILPLDMFGAVRITPVEFTRRGKWRDTGKPMHYSDSDD
jgi:hypothetical protein